MVFLCFVAFVGLTLVLLPMLDLRTMERERDRKIQELEDARKEEKLTGQICDALESDPTFNEVVARDKGLAKPNEKVVRFPQQPTEAPTPAAPTTPRRD